MCDRKTVVVKWKKIDPKAVIPFYAHEGDAGFDLACTDDITLQPGQYRLATTGLKVELQPGYELQVRPRSGQSLKTPLMVKNSPGTIDSQYRGPVGVIVYNCSASETMHIKAGERIAQGVIKEVPKVVFVEVSDDEDLSATSRGEDGFGSTGQ